MFDYNDPKGFQGNINDTTIQDRYNLQSIVTNCLSKVNEAIWFEQYYSNESAINKWIEIFKDKFVMELCSNTETKKLFPFDFKLEIIGEFINN